MSNGSYHTLYSMRRAVAQKAYEENLEEEYYIDNKASDDATTKEMVQSAEPISQKSKVIKKTRMTKKKHELGLTAARRALQQAEKSRVVNRYIHPK